MAKMGNDNMNGGDGARHVLISGGARGIGRSLARNFLQRGNRVFILDIDEEELKYTTEVHLKSFKSNVSSAICNLRDVDDISEKVKQAAHFFGGRIDVLINNGGIPNPHWKDSMTIDGLNDNLLSQWRAYLDTNLTAPFACSAAAIPYMKATSKGASEHTSTSGSVIIHIGSFRALQSDPNQEGYASSKAGLLGLMHSTAATCAQWGIRVNLVAPGRIKVAHESKEGDGNGVEWEETLTEEDVDHHATNRAGRPDDVYQAVEYLVKSGFVTGQDITVDGGVTRQK